MFNMHGGSGASLPLTAFAGVLGLAMAVPAQQLQHYTQTNLVSDTTTDTNLINGWGMSRGTGTPWWISDNGTGKATLYSGTGSIVPLVVTIPSGDPNKNPTGTPTGQVFNGTSDFQLSPNAPAKFIFATEDGTISAWNGGASAVIQVNTKGASVFKGLAMATINDNKGGAIANFLYAADFRRGRIRVYDKYFHPISLGEEAFRDDRVRHGFAPFNIQNIGGNLYVAYAKQDSEKHDEVAGTGLGYVDVFTPWGHLINRLEHGWWFNAPWGLAQAPSDFGAFSHDILVGQFGAGTIAVFDPVTGRFKGQLNDAGNNPIWIDGLWGIAFGSGGTSGPANSLFFAAGPQDESHGLFGVITPVENVLGGDQ
ncbi:MAG TPA: TIGR03118 family protein [Terracidiphilus sp.]|nr:TIGR03118 family protein [Terracidiphilus sp.]